MDPSEGNAEEIEIGSSCSSDKENSTSSESPIVLKDLPKSQNLDVDDDETMEELDFEEERRDIDLQKYVNVLQTSVQQNIISDSQNELSPRKNGESNSQTELRNKSFENSDPGKENCEGSDMEEGETVDDGECVDVEDGEIDDVSKSEDLQKFSCRFFRQGRCIWGKDCRYLHLSDKGLYNMFDSPSKPKKLPLQTIAAFVNEPKFVYQPPPPQPPPVLEKSPDRGWVEKSSESVWDRALNEAKERIKQSKMRKDDNTFNDTMHVQVEKNDRPFGKSKSGFSRDKPLSPVPMNERVVCSFSNRYNANKFGKSKNFSSVKSNMNRNTSERKAGFDSEWTDPWSRSKTPLKRKRCPSKSFSDSSSISSDISRTSWERDSKDKSPSPKRSKNQRTFGRDRRSRSFGHKDSPARSWRASSGSHKGSSSSHSRSSSPKFGSSVNRYQNRKTNVRSPLTSPAYRKRKSQRSPDSIVLPYKRVDRSVSPPVTHRKVFTKVDSVAKRDSLPLVRQKPVRHSRSRSHSSSKSVVRRMSAESSGSQSRSDVSFSSISDSSLSKKSSLSDADFPSNKYTVRNTEVPKMKSDRSVKVTGQRLIDILPRARRSPSAEKRAKKEISNSVPVAKIQTQAKPKPKRVAGLEMELLKYQHQIRGPKPKPTQLSPKQSPVKAESKSPPTASNITVTKNHEADTNSEKHSKAIVNSNQSVLSERTLSKRDLLMQQLKAVEDAIARKKKTVYAT